MHLTWSNAWIQAYESSWCTINKFAYANALTGTELFNLLNLSTRYADYTTSCYHTLIKQLEHIGVHSSEHHMHFLNKLIGNLYDTDNLDKYFNPFLIYCPSCMKSGYHAWFHQSIFTDTCPIHNQPLQYLCPCCKRPISMDLNKTKGLPAFMCLCGHNLIEGVAYHSMISGWTKSIEIGAATTFIPSLLKNSSQTYYYPYNSKHTSQPFKILNLSTLRVTHHNPSQLIALKSLSGGTNMSKLNKKHCTLPESSQQNQLYHFVESYIDALKCIAKMLRRNCKNITKWIRLLKHYKTEQFYCSHTPTVLASVKSSPDVLAAYAYLMWRKDAEGHQTFETVHTNLKLDSHSSTFTGLHEHILKSKLFQYFWAQLEELHATSPTVEQYATFYTTMKCLMYDMLLAHYKNWDMYAQQKFMESNHIEAVDLYDHTSYELPFYFTHNNNNYALIVSKVNTPHYEKEVGMPYVSSYAS